MRHNAIPLFCIAAMALLSGCITRTVEIRPVAPVVEAGSAPITARASPYPAPPSSPGFSGTSSRAQDANSAKIDESDNPSGVRIEAVIPGVYSGRSLLFEKENPSKLAVPLEH